MKTIVRQHTVNDDSRIFAAREHNETLPVRVLLGQRGNLECHLLRVSRLEDLLAEHARLLQNNTRKQIADELEGKKHQQEDSGVQRTSTSIVKKLRLT